MMTGVIASILAITLVMVHATLTESAQDVSAHRLAAAGRQLAATYGNAFAGARNRALTVAKDTAVVNALRTAGQGREALARLETPDNSTPAEARLRSLLARSDSAVTAELWTADGQRVAYVGRDVRANVTVRQPSTEGSVPVPHDGLEGIAMSDSGEIGRLYFEDGRVHIWVIAPVADGTRRLGYVTRQYRLATGDQEIGRAHV